MREKSPDKVVVNIRATIRDVTYRAMYNFSYKA